MQLSHEQKRALLDHGYVHIPGVVPRVMVDHALRAINHSIGEHGMNPADLVTLRAQSYCPELRPTPAIRDLVNGTPALAFIQSLVGRIRPITGGQIALRFPSLHDGPPTPLHPHIDGMYSPHNGVRPGTISHFTMLVGVMLSDLPRANMGNLVVWPGTHRLFESYFQAHGPRALLQGMPPIPMPQPVQVLGSAGDVVLVHYQVAHGVAPNLSPHVRYACYYRVHHERHSTDDDTPMTDIWKEWPAIRELADEPSGEPAPV